MDKFPGGLGYLAFALVALLSLGVGGLGVWWLIRMPTSAISMTQHQISQMAHDLERAPPDLIIYQGGRALWPNALVHQYNENSNSFNMLARRGQFQVTGRIAKVSEYNDVLDRISGIYVPLKYDELFLGGGPLPGISLWVKGMTEQDAATFRVGQKIVVSCNGVRVVTDDLVFDDCRRGKKKKG